MADQGRGASTLTIVGIALAISLFTASRLPRLPIASDELVTVA